MTTEQQTEPQKKNENVFFTISTMPMTMNMPSTVLMPIS